MNYFVMHFQAFLLVMIRMSAMIFIAPFFSSDIIPMRLKALLAFLVALVVFPVLSLKGYQIPESMGAYLLMVLREVMIGVFLGFLVSLLFAAFQLAGQYFAVQIGFGINEVIDPLAQVSIPLIGQFKNMIGVLVFLAINAHHFLLQAICRSYELAPIMSLDQRTSAALMKYLVHSFSGMFVIALKIALPVVATIFLVSISLGVLAKAAPQMNIFMLGFPFKIVVAFAVMAFTAPLVVRIMRVALERGNQFITKVLLSWPG